MAYVATQLLHAVPGDKLTSNGQYNAGVVRLNDRHSSITNPVRNATSQIPFVVGLISAKSRLSRSADRIELTAPPASICSQMLVNLIVSAEVALPNEK